MRFFIIYFFSTTILLASTSDYLEKFQQKQLHTPICNFVINEEELNVDNSLLGFLNLKNKIKNIEDFENLYKRSDLKKNQPILYSQNGFIKQINYIT